MPNWLEKKIFDGCFKIKK